MLCWIRQTRIGGDDWSAPDVPLGEASEAWQVELEAAGESLLLSDITAPELAITDALLTGGFGAVPDHLAVRVSQISARVGAGPAAMTGFDL